MFGYQQAESTSEFVCFLDVKGRFLHFRSTKKKSNKNQSMHLCSKLLVGTTEKR